MSDFLDILAEDSKKTIESGYYHFEADLTVERRGYSLRESILRCEKNPIIAEIKLASPVRKRYCKKHRCHTCCFRYGKGWCCRIIGAN